jgi:zinc protease
VVALARTRLRGEHVVLAVAGSYDRRRLPAQLARILSKLPRRTGAAPALPTFTAPAEIGDFIEERPREQAVVFQAFPGPGLKSPDFYVGEVADELFSGMSSRLFERVREEKGLAYFVRSSRVSAPHAGMFYFYAGTHPTQANAVLEEFDAEIARVAAGELTADEFARACTRLKAARRMSLQTNGARALQAGLHALLDQPVDDWKNYDRHIDSVTPADVQVFTQRYLARGARTQLVVQPAAPSV